MRLIVGLGNPGKKYEKTRHNLGFMVVDELARKWTKGEITWEDDKRFKSYTLAPNPYTLLVKPQTYMNNSGMAVVKLCNNLAIEQFSNLWVIHDDLDIPVGRIKISKGKGTGGHHGVESVIQALSSTDFVRFRLGIARSKADNPLETLIDNPEKFVLEPFLPQESDEVRRMIKQVVNAIEVALKDGIEKAISQFNR